jgi:translation elongation factor EF-G
MSSDMTQIRCSVPDTIEGEVLLCLNRFGGMITTIEQEANSRTGIGATLPRKHLADFKVWLNSYSSGQSSLSED